MKTQTDYLQTCISTRLHMWRNRPSYHQRDTMAEHVKRHLQSSSGWGGTPFKIEGSSIHGRWMEQPESHFRFGGLARKRNGGWYTDYSQDDVARGVVYQMVADKHADRDYATRYIAAIADPNNSDKEGYGPCIVECSAHGSPFIYVDKDDAARSADQFAERYAESERADDAKQQAEMQIEDKKEEIRELRANVRNIIAEMRDENSAPPTICKTLWQVIASKREEMHDAWKRIKTLTDEPWQSVQ